MRTRTVFLAFILALILPDAFAVAKQSNPIPGVGIVVKRHPGSSTAFVVPGGFFGPGSEPFTGVVELHGPCDSPCDPCNCGDLRLDYSTETAAGPFDTEMVAMTLHSVAPITVQNSSGIDSFFDVWVEVSAVGGGSPVRGGLVIAPGTSLLPGTSSFVVDSFFDIEYRIDFSEPGSTVRLPGGPFIRVATCSLQQANLPITCIDDGSATGVFALGLSASGTQPFTYRSADGGLVLELESVVDGVVGTSNASWGAVKTLFR